MVDFFTNLFQFALLAKIFLLVVILFFLVFTLVVYRQITLMTQTLNSSVSPVIKTIAVVQIFVVAGLFLVALFLL